MSLPEVAGEMVVNGEAVVIGEVTVNSSSDPDGPSKFCTDYAKH